MLLSEINSEYQKKRMIVYNADGTKPIVHNIEVAPIFGNIYMSRLEKSDTRSYAACDLYLYLEDHGVGPSMFPFLVAFLKSVVMQPSMRKCITDFRIR